VAVIFTRKRIALEINGQRVPAFDFNEELIS
jgi:hypothetical protein